MDVRVKTRFGGVAWGRGPRIWCVALALWNGQRLLRRSALGEDYESVRKLADACRWLEPVLSAEPVRVPRRRVPLLYVADAIYWNTNEVVR